MTEQTLSARVRNAIERDEHALAELVALADEARAKGDHERYWALTAPTRLADLYLIAGERTRAREQYVRYADYWLSYRSWIEQSGGRLALSYAEACDYLMAGKEKLARTALLALRDEVPEERAELLGIPLVSAGATAEGRTLLRRRLVRLRSAPTADASALHQQAEVAYWLGDLELAHKVSEAAVERWPEPQARPPVLALRSFLAALTRPGDTGSVEEVREVLARAALWFLADGFTSQAADACEYQQLLEAVPAGEPPARVRGMTMLWG
jgi:predicted Zn-dependent protease